jgi:hypothetical protein
MTGRMTIIIILILMMCLSAVSVFAVDVKNIVSVETGYTYTMESRDFNLDNAHGLSTTVYYGYVIHEKPAAMTVLSLVAGYNQTADFSSENAISGFVYAHLYFTNRQVSLLAAYGLQFNQIRLSGNTAYSYGHHTKLTIGAAYNMSTDHKLALSGNYNFVSFPNFDISNGKWTFLSLSLRYIYVM